MSVDPAMDSATARRKILIVYANTGGGHLSAARALQAAFQLRFPDQFNVVIANVTTACDSQRVRMLYESYNMMLKADPRYAKHGLRLLNSVNIEKMVIPMLPRAFRNLRRLVAQEQPDCIVSVHGIVNHSLLRALRDCGGYGRVPYVIVCTDLTNNFLRGWANADADLEIVFSEMARRQLCDFGVPNEKITVINGFPVHPEFFMDRATKAECRAALGLDPDLFTVLVSMGGMAIPRKTVAVVKALRRSGLPLQVLVVCGMNRSLQRVMERTARRQTSLRMHVYGFTNQLAQMMTAAEVMISKPGPGTIMEAVIKEIPLLLDGVTEPMPQERGNLDFALEQGIAEIITSYRDLGSQVERLLHDAACYDTLKANMRRIKNEEGVLDAAEAIVAQLREHALV